jgi:hypothetical protein
MTTEAYQQHPLRSSVNQLLAMRDAPDFHSETLTTSETYVFALDKVFAIAQALNDLIDATPPELVSVPALGQLHSHIQTPINELNAYISDKSPGHITNAAAQLELNILPLLYGFAPTVQRTAKQTFPALFAAQAENSNKIIASLRVQHEQLSTELEALKRNTDEMSKALQDLRDGASAERAAAAASVAKLEQNFTERETERQTKFEDSISEWKNTISIQNLGMVNSANKLIQDIEQHRENAAKIVQVVGNIGVTGNYQQIANRESTQANLWRWITVGIFALGLCVAGATFYKFWGQALTPETGLSVFIRLLYAIAITTPAWYTARESARHRTNADRARQTELELASIGPFIELLPEEKKVEIRERMTSLYFGRAVDVHTISSPFDPAILKEIAVEVAKAVKPQCLTS